MHGKSLDALLNGILDLLEADEVLPPNAVDHALVGNFAGYRDCHNKKAHTNIVDTGILWRLRESKIPYFKG